MASESDTQNVPVLVNLISTVIIPGISSSATQAKMSHEQLVSFKHNFLTNGLTV